MAVGIILMLLGAFVALAGLQVYFILLPISGFLFGLFGGAGLAASLFGGGFLSSAMGLVFGIVGGLLCAVLAYAYWYFGALLAFAMAGFALGAALFGAFGITSPFFLFILAFAVAAVFFLVGLYVNLPVYVVVIGTALTGATIAMTGFLVMFGWLEPSAIGTAEAWNFIHGNLLLWIIWAVALLLAFSPRSA